MAATKIYIDADACPVTDIVIKTAMQYDIECIMLCDTSHVIEREHAKTITVDKGSDSVDFKLVNLLQMGDFVITQDYGLAAMCLSRKAYVINQNGLIYNEDNIDRLLYTRYIGKKIRKGGGRTKGPAPRTADMDKAFEKALRGFIEPIMYLKRDYILNVGILESIRTKNANIISYCKDGVLIFERRSGYYMLCADNEEAVKFLFKNVKNCDKIIVVKQDIVSTVKQITKIEKSDFAYQLFYPYDKPLSYEAKLEIRHPKTDFELDIVAKNYHLADKDEIIQINNNGNIWCGFENGEMVGFIGCHLDGSIGMLEVFPKFRGRGYATELESFIVNEQLKKGLVPYCDVFTDNDKSLGLQKKLGFICSETPIYWLFK